MGIETKPCELCWDKKQAVRDKERAEKKQLRERYKITWRDICFKLDNIADGAIKAAIVCGAWGVVVFLFGMAYGVTTGNLVFK